MLPFEAGFIYTVCVKRERGVAFSLLDSPSSFPISVQESYLVTYLCDGGDKEHRVTGET